MSLRRRRLPCVCPSMLFACVCTNLFFLACAASFPSPFTLALSPLFFISVSLSRLASRRRRVLFSLYRSLSLSLFLSLSLSSSIYTTAAPIRFKCAYISRRECLPAP